MQNCTVGLVVNSSYTNESRGSGAFLSIVDEVQSSYFAQNTQKKYACHRRFCFVTPFSFPGTNVIRCSYRWAVNGIIIYSKAYFDAWFRNRQSMWCSAGHDERPAPLSFRVINRKWIQFDVRITRVFGNWQKGRGLLLVVIVCLHIKY